MASSLSNDVVAQVAPILGSLARLIANGTLLRESTFRALLLGVGMEDDVDVMAEVGRWGKMLATVQEDPELRLAITESLLLRNLPEATVVLAVALVADEAGRADASSASAPTLTAPVAAELAASVEQFDFGTLPVDMATSREFEVFGGPGQVVTESDQVQVTPTQFGVGSTRLRVDVRSVAGGVLWTSVKLVTASRTLELPLIAQWQPGGASTAPGAPHTGPTAPGLEDTERRYGCGSAEEHVNSPGLVCCTGCACTAQSGWHRRLREFGGCSAECTGWIGARFGSRHLPLGAAAGACQSADPGRRGSGPGPCCRYWRGRGRAV